MAVSSVSTGSFAYTSGKPRESVANDFFTRISEKYSGLTMRQGKYRTLNLSASSTNSNPKVFINNEFLFEASQDSELEERLQDKLGNLSSLQKTLAEKFSTYGRKLVESGFEIDKKGNLLCKGKGKVGDKEESFSINLGKVSERLSDFTSRLSSRFDVQAFRLLNQYV